MNIGHHAKLKENLIFKHKTMTESNNDFDMRIVIKFRFHMGYMIETNEQMHHQWGQWPTAQRPSNVKLSGSSIHTLLKLKLGIPLKLPDTNTNSTP